MMAVGASEKRVISPLEIRPLLATNSVHYLPTIQRREFFVFQSARRESAHVHTTMMLRLLVALALVLGCSAFSPATGAALQLSKVATSRADASVMMAAKKVVKKAAAKKAVAKKAAPKPAPKPNPAPAKKVVAKKSCLRARGARQSEALRPRAGA